jgi:transcriptional regulator with XRE-family HTH domain
MPTMTLKTARERRGMTQDELSAASGLDQATVSRLESGFIRNPSMRAVLKLERALRLKRGTLRFDAIEAA